jgi:hypothetical protein
MRAIGLLCPSTQATGPSSNCPSRFQEEFDMYRTKNRCRHRWPALILLLLLTSLHSGLSLAGRIQSDGYGDDRAKAREDALSSLAYSIFVKIESDTQVRQSDHGEDHFQSSTHSHSDLPLMGVDFDYRTQGSMVHCQASLDLERAQTLYRQELAQLKRDIDQQYAALDSLPASAHYGHLSTLLGQHEQFEKYLTVLTYLQGNANHAFQPAASKVEIQNKLLALEKRVTSLALAAQLLAKGIEHKAILVRPATLEGSRAVTPFAKALLDQLNSHLDTVTEPQRASHQLSGHYRIHQTGILLSYSLSNKQGKTLKKWVLELDPASYQGYDTQPRDLDFDHLLHSGYVVPSDLKAELATDRGSRELAFETGDEVKVLVKVNQPAYLYVVGHINSEREKLSYLLDIGPQQEVDRNQWQPDRFIRYIGPAEANKWVELAPPFAVCPPQGEESLQLIVSSQTLRDNMPKANWSEPLGYYVVGHDSKQAVAKTRGLKPKPTPTANTVQSAEAVLTFATFAGKAHCSQ